MAYRPQDPTLAGEARRTKMSKDKNFMARAFDALIASRQREAQRYVERFERNHPHLNKLTDR
jgi:hypothetical protein